jgi:hypothetical protein
MYNPPISCKTAQNIYITSDEDLKAGDYVYSTSQNYNIQKVSKVLEKSYNDTEHYKKIILTTDQDLIKDGVQAIDDDFLEWFFINPSCEFVEIERIIIVDTIPRKSLYDYKIIIPKEEPKPVWKQIIEDCGGEEAFMEAAGLKPKQETLEEAIERLYGDGTDCEGDIIKSAIRVGRIDAFYDATKWQQERSYSEEEVILFCEWFAFELNHYGYPTNENILKALKQFKKK